MPKTLGLVTRKAVKEHACDYCGFKIERGETYENSTHVYDGEIYDWKSHLSCKELVQELDMFDNCGYEGLTAEAFQELVDDFLCGQDVYFKTWAERIARAKEMLLQSPKEEKKNRRLADRRLRK